MSETVKVLNTKKIHPLIVSAMIYGAKLNIEKKFHEWWDGIKESEDGVEITEKQARDLLKELIDFSEAKITELIKQPIPNPPPVEPEPEPISTNPEGIPSGYKSMEFSLTYPIHGRSFTWFNNITGGQFEGPIFLDDGHGILEVKDPSNTHYGHSDQRWFGGVNQRDRCRDWASYFSAVGVQTSSVTLWYKP